MNNRINAKQIISTSKWKCNWYEFIPNSLLFFELCSMRFNSFARNPQDIMFPRIFFFPFSFVMHSGQIPTRDKGKFPSFDEYINFAQNEFFSNAKDRRKKRKY